MRLNSKVTWGLAWTGLAVVLAVPSADFLTGGFGKGNGAAVLTSDVDPVKTAAVEPASTVTTVKTENGIRIVPAGAKPAAVDPVAKTGKPLPDYISDGDAPAEPATQVASIDPTPPVPFPSWARPVDAPVPTAPALTTVTPTGTIAPAATASTTTTTTTTTPTVTATNPEPVVIVDETLTGAINEPALTPVPPAPIVDDSENWDTETLRQYLERRGILEGGEERSTATVTERSNSFDDDGFYLNEGPNSDRTTRETRRQRLERLFEESGDDPESFTLF